MPGLSREQLLDVLRKYGRTFPRILLVPDLAGISSLWVETTDLGGMLGLKLRQNLFDPWSQLTKRAIELVLTTLALLALSPIIAVIALAVKLGSRGPVFFSQIRHGEGKQFRVWKFRTMVTNAEQVLMEYLMSNPAALAEWSETQKLQMDPRVTGLANCSEKQPRRNCLSCGTCCAATWPWSAHVRLWSKRSANMPWRMSGTVRCHPD